MIIRLYTGSRDELLTEKEKERADQQGRDKEEGKAYIGCQAYITNSVVRSCLVGSSKWKEKKEKRKNPHESLCHLKTHFDRWTAQPRAMPIQTN